MLETKRAALGGRSVLNTAAGWAQARLAPQVSAAAETRPPRSVAGTAMPSKSAVTAGSGSAAGTRPPR